MTTIHASDAVADRIRRRRKLRGWSIRHAADRAGVSASTWSRIEAKRVSCNNRFTLASIARALECPIADLTGEPPEPTTRSAAETGSVAHAAMSAIIGADLRYPTPAPAPTPIGELEREVWLLKDLVGRCEYVAAAQRLPALLLGLHTAAVGSGKDKPAALRGLVLALESATHLIRHLGHPASATMAAERAEQAAEALGDDPVMMAIAGWSHAHAAFGCGMHERGGRIADRAARDLAPHMGRVAHVPEVLGMLHLTQGYAATGLGRLGDAVEPLAEAEALAARTGDTDTLGFMFGPTNIRFWRVAMNTDAGEPGRAVEIARNTNPQAIPRLSRQTMFYLDTGRALAGVGKDREALRMLLTAERMAPQGCRDPLTLETVRGLLERARRDAGLVELRGLCSRLGVA